MLLAPGIALRYLLSKKSHSAVGVISAVAVASVAVATAAIVIVLSVFNGFTSVASGRLAVVDADLKAVPASGKTFANADSLASVLAALPQLSAAAAVVEDRGLAMCADAAQMPVVFKGVPQGYEAIANLKPIIVDGEFSLSPVPALFPGEEESNYAVASAGVAMGIGARPGAPFKLYAPRRIGRINPANPATAFMGENLAVAGVFQLDQPEYDKEYLYVPLEAARRLLQYAGEGTALEMAIAPGTTESEALDAAAKVLGPGARILTKQQQEQNSFKMIMVEKWVTFLMLAFILVIAAFNIISTLSLMVIEKRDNMDTLRALGATRAMVRAIFIWEGLMVTFAGGIAGIILGSALTLAQQWGGFVKLSGDASMLSITAYPVRLLPSDLAAVALLIACVALAAAAATTLISSKK